MHKFLWCTSWKTAFKASFSVRCMAFLTLHNKSHNMKALVILSHWWSPFLPLTCLYGKNEILWVSVWPSGIFLQEKTHPRLPMQITWPRLPVGRFSHGLINIRQMKMLLDFCESLIVYILLSTYQWVHRHWL